MDDSDIVKAAYRKNSAKSTIHPRNSYCHRGQRRNVLIAGQVPSADIKSQIENVVRNVDGVKTVFNQLTISGPSADLFDQAIAGLPRKIKSPACACKECQSKSNQSHHGTMARCF